MNKYVYWIWLRLALKGDVKLMYALWKVAGSAENIYRADRSLLEHWGVSDRRQKDLLDKNLDKSNNIFGICQQFGLEILCIDDADYPEQLLQLSIPPCLLFYQGDLFACLQTPSLTVIGTRYSTATGEALASEFAHHLATAGFTLFCGVADGIEAMVHRAVVNADGRCVLLLPGGLLTVSKRVSSLIRDVLPLGAVISECLPNEKGGYDAYQVRNRLLSGFTAGTLILQAPHKSGAMMTAGYALEQGKDVFVLPGGLRDPSYAGNNELLREGATPVIDPADIVRFYLPSWKEHLQEVVIEDEAFESVVESVTESTQFDTAEEQLIFSKIPEEGITADELAQSTELPVHQVLSALTMMELKGWVAPQPGGKFKTIV